MKSWLFWVHGASEFIIVFFSGWVFVVVVVLRFLFVVCWCCFVFFKKYSCLCWACWLFRDFLQKQWTAISLLLPGSDPVKSFLSYLISCYSNFMLFFLLNVSPVYSFLVCKSVISILQSGGSGLQKTSCHSAMPHAVLLERLFAGRFVVVSLPRWLQVSSLHSRQQDPLFWS